MHVTRRRLALIFSLFYVLACGSLGASPTSITYQGELQESGAPFNGSVDLTFRLYDAEVDGNQVGPTIDRTGVNVEDGLFQVALDFGAVYGGPRWLEIEVDGNLLSPRQRLTQVPFAIRGSASGGFQAGETCSAPSDCASGICQNGTCEAATCSDGLQNGTETGIDCGGPDCRSCLAGKDCQGDGDCQSGVCRSRTCQEPTCSDGVVNGQETGPDCGGPDCVPCDAGRDCQAGSDCTSGVCYQGSCRAPTCSDGIQNGTETDVDCGGLACRRCSAGKTCNLDIDCESGSSCQSGTCG